MRYNIVVGSLFFIISLFASEFDFEGNIQFNKPYLFVPLGCNCWVAQALRTCKAYSFRDAAFPFDWLFSLDNDGLVKCLDENFEHFFDKKYFIRYDFTNLENTRYNFQFTHDWPYSGSDATEEKHLGQLAFIREKYTRRIERFNNLRYFKGKVFFVRCLQTNSDYKGEYGWNSQNALNLNNALKRFFPELNFTLVIISSTDPAVSEIGYIEGVKEYKLVNMLEDNFLAFNIMFMDLVKEFLPHY